MTDSELARRVASLRSPDAVVLPHDASFGFVTEPFVEIAEDVLVLPSEVAAVTQDHDLADCSRVYLRGGGAVAHLLVRRPVADVARVLEQARTGDDPAS